MTMNTRDRKVVVGAVVSNVVYIHPGRIFNQIKRVSVKMFT